jgi:hypothetical protein
MLLRQLDAMLFARAPRLPARRLARVRRAEVILRLDAWLRRRQGIFEFSDNPDCILRAQVRRLETEVALSDGTSGSPGDRVLHIHLWNEHVPPTPSGGPSLLWGRHFNRCLAASLRDLARFMASRPELIDIAIILADMSIGSTAQNRALHRIVSRHGFEIIPVLDAYHCLQSVGRAWRQVLAQPHPDLPVAQGARAAPAHPQPPG